MMKHILTLLLLLVATLASAQEYQKGTGLSYFDTQPTEAPSLKRGSEWAYAIEEKVLYRYDRDSLAWVPFAGGIPGDIKELSARIALVEDSLALIGLGLDSLRERITVQELRQDTFTYLIQDSILVTKRGNDVFRLDTIRLPTGGAGSADNQELTFVPETGRLLILRGNEVDLSSLRDGTGTDDQIAAEVPSTNGDVQSDLDALNTRITAEEGKPDDTGTDDQDATEVPALAPLSGSVQQVLQDHENRIAAEEAEDPGGGGTGTDDQTAEEVSVVAPLTGTVQRVLEEHESDIDGLGVRLTNEENKVDDTGTDDQIASEVPTTDGNVQADLDELAARLSAEENKIDDTGTDDQIASEVPTTDGNVQADLDELASRLTTEENKVDNTGTDDQIASEVPTTDGNVQADLDELAARLTTEESKVDNIGTDDQTDAEVTTTGGLAGPTVNAELLRQRDQLAQLQEATAPSKIMAASVDVDTVLQTAHPFTQPLQPVALSSGGYLPADATTGALAVGVVYQVLDQNRFTLISLGTAYANTPLAPGEDYYLQPGGGYGTSSSHANAQYLGRSSFDNPRKMLVDVQDVVYSPESFGGGGVDSAFVVETVAGMIRDSLANYTPSGDGGGASTKSSGPCPLMYEMWAESNGFTSQRYEWSTGGGEANPTNGFVPFDSIELVGLALAIRDSVTTGAKVDVHVDGVAVASIVLDAGAQPGAFVAVFDQPVLVPPAGAPIINLFTDYGGGGGDIVATLAYRSVSCSGGGGGVGGSAGPAAAVNVTLQPSGNLSSTNVQAGMYELQADIDAGQVTDNTQNGRLTALELNNGLFTLRGANPNEYIEAAHRIEAPGLLATGAVSGNSMSATNDIVAGGNVKSSPPVDPDDLTTKQWVEDAIAAGSGGGTASYADSTYVYATIWAEEVSSLNPATADGYQWSFGNGSDGHPLGGVVPGYACEAVSISYNSQSTSNSADIALVVDGVVTNLRATNGGTDSNSAQGTGSVSISETSLINFKTISGAGGGKGQLSLTLRQKVPIVAVAGGGETGPGDDPVDDAVTVSPTAVAYDRDIAMNGNPVRGLRDPILLDEPVTLNYWNNNGGGGGSFTGDYYNAVGWQKFNDSTYQVKLTNPNGSNGLIDLQFEDRWFNMLLSGRNLAYTLDIEALRAELGTGGGGGFAGNYVEYLEWAKGAGNDIILRGYNPNGDNSALTLDFAENFITDVNGTTLSIQVAEFGYWNVLGAAGSEYLRPEYRIDMLESITTQSNVQAGSFSTDGDITLLGGVVTGLGAPTDPSDATTKQWVEAQITASGGGSFTGDYYNSVGWQKFNDSTYQVKLFNPNGSNGLLDLQFEDRWFNILLSGRNLSYALDIEALRAEIGGGGKTKAHVATTTAFGNAGEEELVLTVQAPLTGLYKVKAVIRTMTDGTTFPGNFTNGNEAATIRISATNYDLNTSWVIPNQSTEAKPFGGTSASSLSAQHYDGVVDFTGANGTITIHAQAGGAETLYIGRGSYLELEPF